MATDRAPSAREAELLEAAYRYALTHGLADLSLRPLAAAIGSSPRVLLYLFDSKDGLVKALLARARADELAMLRCLRDDNPGADLLEALNQIWEWVADSAHRDLLALWLEGYARSLTDPNGPWAGFAEQTVSDWLAVLKEFQPHAERTTRRGSIRRTAALTILRGALLDLLATGDVDRVGTATRLQIRSLKDDRAATCQTPTPSTS
jgi:AcrR family transcriptional regulator